MQPRRRLIHEKTNYKNTSLSKSQGADNSQDSDEDQNWDDIEKSYFETSTSTNLFSIDATRLVYQDLITFCSQKTETLYKGLLDNSKTVAIRKFSSFNSYRNIADSRYQLWILETLKKGSEKEELKDYAIHVITYHGAVMLNTVALVFDFYNAGKLTQHIRLTTQRKDTRDWYGWGNDIATQIAKGLFFLQANSIVHCDIKPDNIMIQDENGKQTAIIIDFDLSQFSSLDAPSIRGTPIYQAPEIINEREPHSYASDMFSFGMTVIEIKTGKEPYHEHDLFYDSSDIKKFLNTQIAAGKQIVTIPQDFNPLMQDFVKTCLLFKPAQRPDAKKAIATLEADLSEYRKSMQPKN